MFLLFSSKLRGTPTKNVKTLNIFVNSTDEEKKKKKKKKVKTVKNIKFNHLSHF